MQHARNARALPPRGYRRRRGCGVIRESLEALMDRATSDPGLFLRSHVLHHCYDDLEASVLTEASQRVFRHRHASLTESGSILAALTITADDPGWIRS